MRQIFSLIRRECGFLIGSIVLIGLILTIFCGAFLSVMSVFLDVPAGIYDYFTDVMKLHAVSVPDVTFAEAEKFGGDWVYATKSGLTTNVEVTGKKTIIIDAYETKDKPYAYSSTQRTFACTPKDAYRYKDAWEKHIAKGQWFENAGEIVVTTDLAKTLGGVTVGDTITLGETPFKLVGLIQSSGAYSSSTNGKMPPLCSFWICVDENEKMDYCYLCIPDAEEMRLTRDRLVKSGIDARVAEMYDVAFGNVDLCRAFFGSIALVLGIMVLFILYSLTAIFYRQRKSQICRFRLLGAKTGTIASVYCLIIVAVAFFAVGIGTGLSVWFNSFFMSLCTKLFKQPFTAHFYIAIPLLLVLCMSVFITVIYWIYSFKIKNAHIAQEVKHE